MQRLNAIDPVGALGAWVPGTDLGRFGPRAAAPAPAPAISGITGPSLA